MKVFRNPNQKKQELKNLIKNLTLDERYLFKKKDLTGYKLTGNNR